MTVEECSVSNQDWEYSKENIQPLRKGRNLSVLQKSLDLQSTGDGRLKALESERQSFEEKLADKDECDDPLDLYLQYIKWMEESYPSGSPNYVELLERCNQEFKDDDRYKNDPRYLRNWLTYSNCCSDPTDVFTFLKVNDIGTSLALLYESWAGVYETKGQHAKADRVFQEGINVKARPVERLKKRHREFQIRLAKQIKEESNEEAAEETSKENSHKPRKLAAGVSDVFGTSKSKAKAKPGELGIDKNAKRSQFAVFVDDEFSAKSSSQKALDFDKDMNINSTGKEWKSFASRDESLKENVHKPTTWNTTLSSENKEEKVPKLPFKVFDDKIKTANANVASSRKCDRPILSVNLSTPSQPSQSFSEKFKRKDVERNVNTAKSEKNGLRAKAGKTEKKGYNEDLLFFNGKETCFEEIRALQHECIQEDGYDSSDNHTQMLDLTEMVVKMKSPSEETDGRLKRRKFSMGHSPTINTKAALDDILGMFNDPLETKDSDEEYDNGREEVTTLLSNEQIPSLGRIEVFEDTASPDPRKREISPREPVAMHSKGKEAIEVFDDFDENSLPKPVNSGITDKIPVFEDSFDENLQQPFNSTEADSVKKKGLMKPEISKSRKGLGVGSKEPFAKKTLENDEFEYNNQLEELCRMQSALSCGTSETPKIAEDAAVQSEDEINLSAFESEEKSCERFKTLSEESIELWNIENVNPDSNAQPPKLRKIQNCENVLHVIESQEPNDNFDLSMHVATEQFPRIPSKVLEHKNSFSIFEDFGGDNSNSCRNDLPLMEETPEPCCDEVKSLDEYSDDRMLFVKKPLSPILECADEKSPCLESSDGKANLLVPVNPFSSSLLSSLVEKVKPSISGLANITTCSGCGPCIPDKLPKDHVIDLGMESYNVQKLLGTGAYAKVYLTGNLSREEMLAMKVQSPANFWELYIGCELEKRLSKPESSSELAYPEEVAAQYFSFIHEGYIFKNKSYMITPVYDQGSLLDIVNLYKRQGCSMDESLVMFYAIELLRIVEILHMNDFIHGDIKPDNLMIRNDECEEDEDDLSCNSFSVWAPDRAGIWSKKGLKIIDFGRSIDLRQFPKNATFVGNSCTSGFQCIEMQCDREWKYQIDLYGILCTIHCLLFNDYMKVTKTEGGRWKPQRNFKRYWQVS